MRATLIVPDNQMKIDAGKFRHVDLSVLAHEGKHAVQWYDTFGEVEFATEFVDAPVLDLETNEPTEATIKMPHRKPNEYITDFGPYEMFVPLYEAEDAAKSAEEKAFQDKMEADKALSDAAMAKANARTEAFNKLPDAVRNHVVQELQKPQEEAARQAERARREAWSRLTPAQQQAIINAAKGT
jgi:site-specific DNA-cytosine methylase